MTETFERVSNVLIFVYFVSFVDMNVVCRIK